MDTFSPLVAQVKISIENPETEINSVFGRGIAELCVGVREKGSLYAAAKSMGMAYSKAWRIMKDTETALGMQLLNRDGAHGSDLTDEGNKLIDVYLELEKKIQTDTDKTFRKLIER
ncbi:MAG: LysR family transcriptional regulator [Raoultibacter sp.]